MNEDAKHDKSRVTRTTDKFDRVLKRHVRRLLDVGDTDTFPPYSLNMIACLLVLAEREKEMTEFPDSPLKYYTREGFLKDLDEIGVEPDETVMVEIQNLVQSGYIGIGENEEYRVREPATRMLSALDAIFPALPGLSLVAYILQAIEEVISGRKEMMQAIRQFDETLLTRGESVSKQRLDTLRRERAAAAAMKKIDPGAQKQREIYLEKLKALRSRQRDPSVDSAVVLTTGYSGKVEIRELFPREPEHRESESIDNTPAVPVNQSIEPSPPPIEMHEPTTTHVPTEKALGSQQPPHSGNLRDAVDPPAAFAEKEAEGEEEEEEEEETGIEDLIAKKIQAFEAQLAMTCPVCKEGKILSDVTEKGKTYYYCSNKACGLVSWGKPYHMACPLCENPFLIEFQQKDDKIGLKCPRATCTFQQSNFDGKPLSPNPGGSSGENVRKVVIRKKAGSQGTQRRLVRRKK